MFKEKSENAIKPNIKLNLIETIASNYKIEF